MSLIRADARALPLRDNCVQMVCTSPPYFGLRDYGTATWLGGDPECDHLKAGTRASGASTLRQDGRDHVGPYEGERTLTVGYPFRDRCGKCGAERVDRQLGLEPTPTDYVAGMVAVFRQVHRVLRDDGVVWLNLGDSYAGSWGAQSRGGPPSAKSTLQGNGHIGGGPKVNALSAVQVAAAPKGTRTGSLDRTSGVKAKELVGVPWLVAFALQADGWYLRSDVVWSKPNPMPESVTDRPTKSHEYVFLLTKAKRYYYDAEAIKNLPAESTLREIRDGYGGQSRKLFDDVGVQNASDVKSRIIDGKRKRLDKQRGHTRRHAGFNERWDNWTVAEQRAMGSNARTVWTIATQPYDGAHFATMPEALAERCILAGSRPGDLVLDPFVGSGTVARCAISLGRRAVGCDLNRAYLSLADERTQVTRGLPLEAEASA